MLYRPLMGFSYGTSLLYTDDPSLDFSFTVTQDGVRVQYRLVEYVDGAWDWNNTRTFWDGGDSDGALLSAGRKQRTLALDGRTS